MPTLADIQIVTVAYNSTQVIGDMLASVPSGVRVVIVDNASTDAQALHTLAQTHGATVITNTVNRGFGAACNIGALEGESELLLFLNPDATLQQGCLEALLAAYTAHPDACAFSPRVLDGRGRPAFRRRSRLLPKSAHWSGPSPQSDAEVPLLNGAAIFVSRSNFNGVGGFDEQIFLYHEDDDLSLRLHVKFGPIRHAHDAIVNHAEGHSSARTPDTAAFKGRHMAQSAVYAMRKHHRPFARTRVVSWAALQMLSPLNLFSTRIRAKNFGFLTGALHAIGTQ